MPLPLSSPGSNDFRMKLSIAIVAIAMSLIVSVELSNSLHNNGVTPSTNMLEKDADVEETNLLYCKEKLIYLYPSKIVK